MAQTVIYMCLVTLIFDLYYAPYDQFIMLPDKLLNDQLIILMKAKRNLYFPYLYIYKNNN